MAEARDDRPISAVIWSGYLAPRHFKTPGSLRTITIGFMALVYAYLFLLLRNTSRSPANIGSDVTELVVRECYVAVGN
eukprot:CAMPEP_0174866006 /NCGR_PEP_ID=MMETSP1114-20130205/61370_1 /TAXON_ID=312471 /ORGANISM="Neobodo designis, Strain CCAP 1951/1" /LENGTH=77 /DNA_ID=CAMNT_0016101147 /DNA_START=363 /DNA_END=593 /DNA_ORIENTATION=+